MDPRLDNVSGTRLSNASNREEVLKTRGTQPDKISWAIHTLSIFFRLITCVAAWIAFYLTMTAKETQTIDLGAIQITKEAKWQYADAFKFHLVASGVVGSYALLTTLIAILVALTGSKPIWLLWAALLLDLVIGYMQIAAVGGTLAVALIGKYGNSHTNWLAICGMFSWFCNRVQWALVASSVSVFNLFESTILDAYNLYNFKIAPKLDNFIVGC